MNEALKNVLFETFNNIADMVNYTRGYRYRLYVIVTNSGIVYSVGCECGSPCLEEGELILAVSYPANYVGDMVDELNYDEESGEFLNYTALEILEGYADLDCVFSEYVDNETLKQFLTENKINNLEYIN